MFCHRAAPSSVSLMVVAILIPLAMSKIRAVAARDTITMMMSMSTITQLTGMAAHHCGVAATAHKIAVVARNTQTTTMGRWVQKWR